MMCFITIILPATKARLVWKKLDIHIVNATQDVLLLTYYILPCGQDLKKFKQPMQDLHFNITRKFENWFDQYTKDIVDKGFQQFCSKQTDIPSVLRSMRMRTIGKSRRRPKRFVEILLGIVVTVVVIEASYHLFKTTTTSSADTATQTLEAKKILARDNDEIQKQIDSLYDAVNITIKKVAGIEEQIEALQIQTTIENQALAAAIVSKFTILENDLREVAAAWQQGKTEPKLVHILGWEESCFKGNCPISLTLPKSCQYNPGTQDLKLEFKRRLTRGDVQLVSVDPFVYH